MSSILRQRREPTMAEVLEGHLGETLDKAVSEENARAYAQPRHRDREPEMPPAANISWQGDALSSVQTTILRMTYGEMMDFSKGLVESLHQEKKEIDEDTMAKGIHHWAVNYKETER